MGHQLYGPLVVGFGVTSYMGHQKSYVTPQKHLYGPKKYLYYSCCQHNCPSYHETALWATKVAIWAIIVARLNKITV